MHPMVKPALRRAWRERQTVQFGITPAHAVVVGPVDTATGSFLDLLDGTRGLVLLREEARTMGLPDGKADALVDRLAAAGLLDDSTAGGRAAEALRNRKVELDRLRADLASLSVIHREPGAAMERLAARRTMRVQVRGAGRVGAAVASVLSASGVGRVDVLDSGLTQAWDVAPGGLPRSRSVSAGTRRPGIWCGARHPADLSERRRAPGRRPTRRCPVRAGRRGGRGRAADGRERDRAARPRRRACGDGERWRGGSVAGDRRPTGRARGLRPGPGVRRALDRHRDSPSLRGSCRGHGCGGSTGAAGRHSVRGLSDGGADQPGAGVAPHVGAVAVGAQGVGHTGL